MKSKMNTRFATEPIPQLIFTLAAPAMVAQLINAFFNIVDRMFVGRIPETGTLALTGLGVAFPITMIISAFALLIGYGGAPLASIKMGAGQEAEAEQLLGNCFTMLLIASVLLTAVFLIFNKPLLLLFGASTDTLPFAHDFLWIYLLGTVAVLLTLGLNPFIAVQGFAKTAMMTICISTVVNIVLDPIFIFTFNMGVKGAALATIISQFVSAGWILMFLTSTRSFLRLRLKHIRIKRTIAVGIISLGLSPFIMQSTESLILIVFNTSLAKFGGDLYVAAMGIMGTLMQIFTLLLQSFAQGAQPIIGYNFGSGDYNRVKTTIYYCSSFCAILGLSMWSVSILMPKLPVLIFTNNQELITLTARLMKIFFLGTCIYGIQLAFQQIFIALGQAKVSIFIAVLRKLLLLIPLVYLLPMFTTPKTLGVILAEPVADFCAVFTCCVLFVLKFRRLLQDKGKLS